MQKMSCRAEKKHQKNTIIKTPQSLIKYSFEHMKNPFLKDSPVHTFLLEKPMRQNAL